MATVTIFERRLKALVRESVHEVLTEELVKLRAFFSPFVSSREQKDIENRYGKPSRKMSRSIRVEV